MDGDNRIVPHLESQELRRGLKFPSSAHSVVMTSREIGIPYLNLRGVFERRPHPRPKSDAVR